MPPLPDVPNVLRIQLKWTYQNDTDVICRIYMAYTGTAPTAAQLSTMATTIGGNWSTIFVAYTSNEVTLTEVEITDLTSPTSAVGTAAVSHAGSASTAPLAAGTAALMNFSVSRRYRGGKPRVYLPLGVAADLLDASAWSTGFVSYLTSNWPTWIADIVTAGAVWGTVTDQVSVSYYEGFTNFTGPTGRTRARSTVRTTPPPIPVDVVTSASCNAKPGSQRRRNLH